MAYLATPTATSEIIRKYNFHFQKKFGQNFLIDANILEKIIRTAEITKEDCVIEIGPGIGTMTQYLIPILQDTLSEYNNVTIVNEDILKIDITGIADEKNGGRPVKIVANLPYYITTPIIMGLFESNVPLSSITIMVQKEVADRMQVGPGTKDYGALSLAVQYYAKPEVIMNVPPACFMPKPGVGSSVVRLTRFTKPPVNVVDEKKFFTIIRAAFNQRRKTLINALVNSSAIVGSDGKNKKVTRDEVSVILEKMGLSQTIRGEALTLEEFAKFSNLF